MDKLRAMALFVKVAESGSFSMAADELDVSKSMLSKEVSKLEQELGSRLLQRSTRKLQLTEIGVGYLQRCRQILMQVADAESYTQTLQSEAKGKLKINAPMALGITHLSAVFSAFMQTYPEIDLEVSLSDEPVDLIEQGFDIGFRATSQMLDSNYIGKPIAQFSMHLVASPHYIANHSEITKITDLTHHNCLIYSYALDGTTWQIGDGIPVTGQLIANNALFIKQAILDGRGIGLTSSFVCDNDIEQGNLVELLPDVKKSNLTFYVLYPAREFVPPKISLCVEFIQNWFAEN